MTLTDLAPRERKRLKPTYNWQSIQSKYSPQTTWELMDMGLVEMQRAASGDVAYLTDAGGTLMREVR